MITVDRQQLNQAIKLASTVTERRSTIPALQGLRLIANGMLAVEGSDLDNFTRAELPYEGDKCELFVCDPETVRAAIGAAGGKAVTLSSNEKRLTVTAGSLALELATLPPDELPTAPPLAKPDFSCKLSSGDLAQLGRLTRAISTEETRYYLNGVNVSHIGEGVYRFAATDGHRLMTVDLTLAEAKGKFPGGFIIHRRTLKIMLDHFGQSPGPLAFNVKAGAHSVHRFTIEGLTDGLPFTVSSKTIDGTYPDYARVFPTETKHAVKCKKSALAQAINALSPLTTERMRAIRLAFEPGKVACSLDVTAGKGSFEIAAEHDAPKDFVIAFNGAYLLDLISSVAGDQIELRFNEPTAPAVIVDPSDPAFLAVQMPMKV